MIIYVTTNGEYRYNSYVGESIRQALTSWISDESEMDAIEAWENGKLIWLYHSDAEFIYTSTIDEIIKDINKNKNICS